MMKCSFRSNSLRVLQLLVMVESLLHGCHFVLQLSGMKNCVCWSVCRVWKSMLQARWASMLQLLKIIWIYCRNIGWYVWWTSKNVYTVVAIRKNQSLWSYHVTTTCKHNKKYNDWINRQKQVLKPHENPSSMRFTSYIDWNHYRISTTKEKTENRYNSPITRNIFL